MRTNPVLRVLKYFLYIILSFLEGILSIISGENVVSHLENIVLKDPENAEGRKSEFAILMNIKADTFENAWQKVASRHPDIFPVYHEIKNMCLITEAIQTLLKQSSKIVTKRAVSQLSGLNIDVVERLWSVTDNFKHYGYIEE